MEHLYLGLTSNNFSISTYSAFSEEELYEKLEQDERIISQYVFPLNEKIQKELWSIYQFADNVGTLQSFLQVTQEASLFGSKWAVELLKSPKLVVDFPGRYNHNGAFIPEITFESDTCKKFCTHCMMNNLTDEFNYLVNLVRITGRVLVEKAPTKVICYWQN